MITTEEIAKTKWCPFARTVDWKYADGELDIISGSANRTHLGDAPLDECLCIGSRCMAWQGRVMETLNGKPEVVVGYCGLAGAPK
jgi:hypothetical protein